LPDLALEISDRFRREAEEVLEPERREGFFKALEWALRRSAGSGQRVVGSNTQIWPYYPNDGYVYVAYYEIAGPIVRVLSVTKRRVPISRHTLGLEE
jgi:hypothetical protein